MAKKHTNQQLPGDTSLPSSAKELQALIKADKGTYKYSVEDFLKILRRLVINYHLMGNIFLFSAL